MKKLTISFLTLTATLFAGLPVAIAQDEGGTDTDPDPAEEQMLTPKAVYEDDEPKPRLIDKLFFGGTANVGGRNGVISVEASPYIGYKLHPRLGVGVWPFYRYFYATGLKQGYNAYGARVFGRINVHRMFRLHAEYESLNSFQTTSASVKRQWYENAFVGAVYVQQMSEKTSMNMYFLYNVTWENGNSPYQSPLEIRFAFEFSK